MSRDWILGLVAAVIWIPTYVLYFVGIGQAKQTARRLMGRIRLRPRGK